MNIKTSNTFNSTKKDELLSPLVWESLGLKYWAQHNLPYLDNVKRKLSNLESLALVKSSIDTCLRIPQTCRRNAIFVISSDHIKNRNDIKGDLNGIFKKCLESKCKTVELGDFSVKFISPKERKLNENHFYINVNRRENIHGLIRNITYFTDSKNKVLNSKMIPQYFINRKKCGDKEELQYIAPRLGNANADTLFFSVKKKTLGKFKKTSFRKR